MRETSYEYDHLTDRPIIVRYFDRAGSAFSDSDSPPVKKLVYENDIVVKTSFCEVDGKTPWSRYDGVLSIVIKWEYQQPRASACPEYRVSGPTIMRTQTYFGREGEQINDGNGVLSETTINGPHGTRERILRTFLRGRREFDNTELLYDKDDHVLFEFYLDERFAAVELPAGIPALLTSMITAVAA